MKLLLYIILLINSITIFASDNYVIIADSWYQKTEFRDRADLIDQIGDDIVDNYKGMILHLGNEIIFEKGGEYYFKTSKQNLKELTSKLNKNDKKVYLWFFDSFGHEEFQNSYINHKEKIEKIKEDLSKYEIYYDGIVIDLEWINYSESKIVDNSKLYLEILLNIKKSFPEKEVLAFASLIDDESENKKRGYDTVSINNLGIKIISMIYIKDGGFVERNNFPQAIISDDRVSQLINYHESKGNKIAVSLEKAIFMKKNNKYYFIRNFRKRDNDFEEIFSNLEFIKKSENKFSTIESYKAKKNISIQKNDKAYQELEKDEIIYIFTSKTDILRENYFIWEYYKMKE